MSGKGAHPQRYTSIESRFDATAHAVLSSLERSGVPAILVEFLAFGVKQAWACLFGGLMLALIIGSALFYPDDVALNRYDALFLGAFAIQIAMIVFRLETLDEVKVICLFHVVGTAMEIFKTAAGSWIYPEEAFFRIGGVPLFSGFMYAAVGSYLARVMRVFDLRFTKYPPLWMTVVLAVAIYVNFFSHHYLPDIRLALFVALAVLYARTQVHYRVFRHRLWMPLLVGFVLIAAFIWIAENIGTVSRTWLYPSQLDGWSLVPVSKLGAWLLLMVISFVMVTLVRPPQPLDDMPEKPD